jgi:hypothetical protein
MAVVLKSANVLKPTDDLLVQFRSLDRTPMERPLNRARLDYLRGELSSGRLLNPPKWARVYCRHNGRHYRLNGQHTSVVFAERPEAERPQVVYEVYECDTPAEVAELFQGFDSRESTRTSGDVTRAVFAATPELAGYPVRLGQSLVGGLFLAKLVRREWAEGVRQDVKTNSKGVTALDKSKAAAEYPGFAAWVRDEFASNAAAAVCGRAPVVAAMLLTREIDQQEAERFWLAVREGSDPRPKSASRVLREYLQEVRLTSGADRSVSQREILAKCLQAWRAHREGADSVRLHYRETSLLPRVD